MGSDMVHWTENEARLDLPADNPAREATWEALWSQLAADGMHWVSPCQGEWNVIHAVDTPVVFRTLAADGRSTL